MFAVYVLPGMEAEEARTPGQPDLLQTAVHCAQSSVIGGGGTAE